MTIRVTDARVYVMTDGRVTVRVTAINGKGEVIYGVSEPLEVATSSAGINDLIATLDASQTHVPHVTSLGKA